MSVIPFPKAAPTRGVLLVKREEENTDLFLNGFSFTCPKCKTKTNFDGKNMIFRMVDFFCKQCGSRYKISNPAFSNKQS